MDFGPVKCVRQRAKVLAVINVVIGPSGAVQTVSDSRRPLF